jgi:hypothetical protein
MMEHNEEQKGLDPHPNIGAGLLTVCSVSWFAVAIASSIMYTHILVDFGYLWILKIIIELILFMAVYSLKVLHRFVQMRWVVLLSCVVAFIVIFVLSVLFILALSSPELVAQQTTSFSGFLVLLYFENLLCFSTFLLIK